MLYPSDCRYLPYLTHFSEFMPIFYEKMDKTREYSKSTTFVWYENGRRRLLGAQSINSERISLKCKCCRICPFQVSWLNSCKNSLTDLWTVRWHFYYNSFRYHFLLTNVNFSRPKLPLCLKLKTTDKVTLFIFVGVVDFIICTQGFYLISWVSFRSVSFVQYFDWSVDQFLLICHSKSWQGNKSRPD